MNRVSAGDYLKAVAIKAVLDRIQRPGATAPPVAGADIASRSPQAETPSAPRRLAPALGLFGAGALLMLLFESPVPRVLGVLALFGFVVWGVFAIADPGWLGSAPHLGQPPSGAASRRPPSG
jgi:hypothetical protein